jgi:hypothetical protein
MIRDYCDLPITSVGASFAKVATPMGVSCKPFEPDEQALTFRRPECFQVVVAAWRSQT